jgi:hypothetical protein
MHPALDPPDEGRIPSFDGATGWLNSPRFTPADLRGKVVAVNFCTYTCINWLRSLPYVRAWAERYLDDGLVTVGVHTPEFSFEHTLEHVERALHQMRVEYPVAVDNDYGVWEAFSNHYWPALYLIDAEGRIRHHRFGEGDYERTEMVIQRLLMEANSAEPAAGLVSVNSDGAEAPADWDHLRSPETYVGYRQATNFASPGGMVPDKESTYDAPTSLRLNEWALSGEWTVEAEAAALNAPSGLIAFRFQARDVHLVVGLGTADAPVRFRVFLDGQPPGADRGSDVDGEGSGALDYPRMYQLIRQAGAIDDRLFEIEFLDRGLEAFVFTFG